jgi:hypothetical protein
VEVLMTMLFGGFEKATWDHENHVNIGLSVMAVIL